MLKHYISKLNFVKRKIFELVLSSTQHITNMRLSLDSLDGNLPLGSNYRVEADDAALALVEEGLGFFISPEHITPTAKLFKQYVYDYMDENNLLNV